MLNRILLFLTLTTSGIVHAELPTNVLILTREDFTGRAVYTVADALQGLPSIDLQHDGYRGIATTAKIRGTKNTNRTVVLMDGLPLGHEFDQQVDLTQIPINLVDRIEITRGAGSLSYGAQGSGGVINIVTSRPSQDGLLTSLGTSIGRNGYKDSSGRFLGRSYWGDFTYAPNRQVSSGFNENDDYDATSHFVNLSRSFNGKGFWAAEYLYHDSENGLSNGTLIPLEQWDGNREKQAATPSPVQNQTLQHVKFTLNKNKIAGMVAHNWRNYDRKNAASGPAIIDQENASTTTDLKFRPGQWEFGAQARQLTRKSFPDKKQERFETGAYAIHKFSTPQWVFQPGARWTHLSKGGDILSPRATLLYTPVSTLLFSANTTRVFRSRTFNESVSTPEKTWSTDGGFDWRPFDSFNLKATAFNTEENSGTETEFTSNLGPFEIAGHWAHNRHDNNAMTPQHLAFVRVATTLLLNIRLSNDVRYESAQYELDNKQGVKVPSHSVWDITLSKHVLKADLYIACENVLQKRYAENISSSSLLIPQASRTFWGGITIEFLN